MGHGALKGSSAFQTRPRLSNAVGKITPCKARVCFPSDGMSRPLRPYGKEFDIPLTNEIRSAIQNRKDLLKKNMVRVTISKEGKKSV